MKVNGMHKRYRLRQDANMIWGFYQVPNPYGEGWVPVKSRHPKKMQTTIPCLFREEKRNTMRIANKLRKRKEK